jgi:NADH-quinone oxidoreductase subunit L
MPFMKDRPHTNQFFGYFLLSLLAANGAVLADNLVAMLFFWEGLLGTLFGMIAIGRAGAFRTATKAFIIVGITDVCMMIGMALVYHLTGTLSMSEITEMAKAPGAVLAMGGGSLGTGHYAVVGLAFVLMMIGAISKGGSMPFHSWIPDAAVDAPLPFMAILPASIEKLLGIYFLSRISLDLFKLEPGHWTSYMLMTIGAVTILLAVMMALVQKDYKRLLSYHAISQVGYMILGIGTMLPIGIVGGIFHMINHAMYKSCLFLTGGSVEKQAGTTDLARLGGIGRQMPITFGCFIIAAAAISGVPPLNGFWSKELVYAGALASGSFGSVFYAAAILGTFLTAASFLKLGHAAFLGKRSEENAAVKEAPLPMLIPMIVIAATCVLFGVYNYLPLRGLIEPIVGARLAGESFAGWDFNPMLVVLTLVALGGALLNHMHGLRVSGSGLHAVDHINHAPILAEIYDRAQKRQFDPYDIGLLIVGTFARITNGIDRLIDAAYDKVAVGAALAAGGQISKAHTGNLSTYVLWSLLGAAVIVVFLIM